MKRLLITLISTAFLSVPMSGLAAKGGEKGPSARAYERANDNASFKRDGVPFVSEQSQGKDKKHLRKLDRPQNSDLVEDAEIKSQPESAINSGKKKGAGKNGKGQSNN